MLNFRIFLFGPSRVGKTCLLNYFNNKPNPKETQPNMGITIDNFKLQIKGDECIFQILDTSGHEKFQEMNLNALKKKLPRLVIIFYELASDDGEKIIGHFIDLVKQISEDVEIAIIGTKAEKGIHKNQQNLEKQFKNYKIYKVSTNIQEIFIELFTRFYFKFRGDLPSQQLLQILDLNKERYIEEYKRKKKSNGFWWFCCGSSD